MNSTQFDIDFPSENFPSSSAAYDQWSLLDPDSPLQSDDEDNDTFIFPPEIDIKAPLSYEIDSEHHESKQLPKRRGRQVNSTFLEPPLGELGHPCIGVTLDKAAMEEYVPNYAKQEGYAVICGKENGGIIYYWRCIHGGKYNNWRNLPVEKTDKEQRQKKLDAGMALKCIVLIAR